MKCSIKMLQNVRNHKYVGFFHFSFQATLHFYLINCLVYVGIDWGIYKIKTQSCLKGKMKKTTLVFLMHKI